MRGKADCSEKYVPTKHHVVILIHPLYFLKKGKALPRVSEIRGNFLKIFPFLKETFLCPYACRYNMTGSSEQL